MPPPDKLLHQPVAEPKPRGRHRKNATEKRPITQLVGTSNGPAKGARIGNREEQSSTLESTMGAPTIKTQFRMRTEGPHDLARMPRTDRDET